MKLFFRSELTKAAQYFPLPKVMEGLFKLCSQLFGIQIKVDILIILLKVVQEKMRQQ